MSLSAEQRIPEKDVLGRGELRLWLLWQDIWESVSIRRYCVSHRALFFIRSLNYWELSGDLRTAEYLGSDGFLVLFRRMLFVSVCAGTRGGGHERTPFAYLETIRGLYTGGMIRSGSYRIMGLANHSLAYGLILISGFTIIVH